MALGDLLQRSRDLRRSLRGFIPSAFPGHFYSPIPSVRELRQHGKEVFDRTAPPTGVELNANRQLALLRAIASGYANQCFKESPTDDRRYHFNNEYFSYGDGLVLQLLLRHLKPSRIVEVGSGYSSAAMLDTIEAFPDIDATCTFIEPYPNRLKSLLRVNDRTRCEIMEVKVQAVDRKVFSSLGPGDILFIDSSHVSKTGSDVNLLFLEIVPTLAPGVWIHVHDIFYPFEYPRDWVLYRGRAWNEAYLLHALLTFNSGLEIMFWNSFIANCYCEVATELMPLWSRDTGGSIWLRRV